VFDGTGDYITTSALHISDSWTMEFWFNTSVNNASQRPMNFSTDLSASNYVYLELTSSGKIKARVSGAAAFGDIPKVSVNEWHHTALSYDGSTAYFVYDGNLIATQSVSYSNHSIQVRFGADESNTSANLYTGYISNARIVSGKALYTTDYTVPIHAFEVTDGTNLLCCNNPDSAGAESTGKSITVNGDAAASSVSPGLTRDFIGGTEFKGVTTFDTQGYFVPPSGTTEQRGGGRGIIASNGNAIEFITITTTGNSQDFGDMTYTQSGYVTCLGSSTRGLIAGGYNPHSNTIDYITIATTGNAKEFGEIGLTNGVYSMGPAGSNTRGLFAGGHQEPGSPNAIAGQQQINYVTFASLGNSSDFGDLVEGVRYPAGCSSPTRAIWAGGRRSGVSPANINNIQYATIATLGNAVDYGDLTYSGSGGVYAARAVSSSTRGVIGGGVISPAYVNSIDYLTIATTGNSQEFGDLNATVTHAATMSNSKRGVFAGGYNPAATNAMSFVTITSTGDAKNFGDLMSAATAPSGMSDSHGGIS